VDDYAIALAHYRLLFPDLASLGTGDPPFTWYAEYNRVVALGLSATLITSTNMEGSAAGASRNFDQKTLLLALHARRGELDGEYLESLTTAPPLIAQPAGVVIRLGP
jgi:hypothetical protein